MTADAADRPSNDGDGGVPPASAAHVDFRTRLMRRATATTTMATAMGRRRLRPSRRRLLRHRPARRIGPTIAVAMTADGA